MHKVAALQPAAREQSRGAGSRLRGQREQGGKVNTINKRTVGVQHMIARGSYPHAATHIVGRIGTR